MRWKTAWLLLQLTLASGCSLDVLSYHHDLDIHTGRIRTTNYVAFVPVHSATRDTAITKALPSDQVQCSRPEWRKINTFYWLLPYSPYHAYHKAFGAIRRFENVASRVCFSPAASQHVASRAIELWQQSDQGSDYLAAVCNLAEEAERLGKCLLDLADLRPASDSGP